MRDNGSVEAGQPRPLDLSSLRAAVQSLRTAIEVVSSDSFALADRAWQAIEGPTHG